MHAQRKDLQRQKAAPMARKTTPDNVNYQELGRKKQADGTLVEIGGVMAS